MFPVSLGLVLLVFMVIVVSVPGVTLADVVGYVGGCSK